MELGSGKMEWILVLHWSECMGSTATSLLQWTSSRFSHPILRPPLSSQCICLVESPVRLEVPSTYPTKPSAALSRPPKIHRELPQCPKLPAAHPQVAAIIADQSRYDAFFS